jgi:GAF domain-containing protein
MTHAERFTEPIDYGSFSLHRLESISPKVRDDYDHFLSEVTGAGLTGRPFLHAVMRSIYDAFWPELLFVGMCNPSDAQVRTLVTYVDGEPAPGFTFNIADTPCTAVLGPQALCIYPADVWSLFPRAPRLQQMRAEGYAGMPLLSRAGERIGILTAITRGPITDLDEVRIIYALFGARLSLELERIMAMPEERSAIRQAIRQEEQRLTHIRMV